ncbi:MAG: hypothetical protein RO257_10440 [Candidatus Kapabacteria bacterium]|nr:hypothetical protein [Candidatus Kapabacteria bacterium]
MNYFKIFITGLVVIFIISSLKLFSAEQVDIIHLKNGSVIVGKIIKYDAGKEVEIQTSDGNRFVFKMEQVEKIDFMVDKDSGFKKTKSELGGTFGTPAVLNFVIGKHFDKYMVKASGLYLGRSAKGIQLELGLKLSEFKRTYHAISLVGGYSYLEYEEKKIYDNNINRISEWTYGGLVYNLNTNGFYLQAGLSLGNGLATNDLGEIVDMPNPQIIFQIGYVYQFRD